MLFEQEIAICVFFYNLKFLVGRKKKNQKNQKNNKYSSLGDIAQEISDNFAALVTSGALIRILSSGKFFVGRSLPIFKANEESV